MGNHQSKGSTPDASASQQQQQEKMLVERLRALQRSRSEGGSLRDTYARRPAAAVTSSPTISEKTETAGGSGGGGLQRKPEGVSVSQMEEWQSAILKEPRYQYVIVEPSRCLERSGDRESAGHPPPE